MKPGDVLSWSRTFTAEDIRAFSQVTGDVGTHHVVPDTHGRLMVQGLLTASLPTRIGGDINYLAESMVFRFHRPVYAGDTIACKVRIEDVEEDTRGSRLSCTWVCTNQEGTVVMTGESQGRSMKGPPPQT